MATAQCQPTKEPAAVAVSCKTNLYTCRWVIKPKHAVRLFSTKRREVTTELHVDGKMYLNVRYLANYFLNFIVLLRWLIVEKLSL
jgi:hypothetical protein